MKGTVGRTSSFEVVVDGKFLAHSKLAVGGFPDYTALAAAIAAYISSKAVPAGWKALA